jgi:TonB family protein
MNEGTSLPNSYPPIYKTCIGFAAIALWALLFPGQTFSGPSVGKGAAEQPNPADPAVRVSAERSGVLSTSQGLTLRLNTDLGSVKIVDLEPGASPLVRYEVHIETDARGPAARQLLDHYSLIARSTASGVEINGTLPPQLAHLSSTGAQFWVQFNVSIPRRYNVEIRTDAGDIETQDIGGIARLSTLGGNIRAGRIGTAGAHYTSTNGPIAKLETQGGHIQVLDVAGDLTAFTAGGHINAGNIEGNAFLHSGGGHIRASQIGGRADLQTEGGNVVVGQAGSLVGVRTGGGQIDFGEVRGSVRAQTGGGGIRIMYVSGPMEVESSAGSICLTRVAGAVRAATAGGSITAWINPDAPSSGGTVHLAGLSQLTSGNGDIAVFLPRNLAADIDAVVESSGDHGIEADPALALNIERERASVRAVGALNGGGALLKLRTSAGKIRLHFLDSDVTLHESLIREQKERLQEHLDGVELTPVGFERPGEGEPSEAAPTPVDKGDWIDRWIDELQNLFVARNAEPDEFKAHLTFSPKPSYPDIARRAGVQGIVVLQVRATKDGHVKVEKILEGSPTLADSAICAVKQWKVRPFSESGKQIEVVSTVTFNFSLHD